MAKVVDAPLVQVHHKPITTLNMEKEFTATATTATFSTPKYDWFTDEILEWVRGAKSEEDAVHNLKVILEHYENKKTFWQKLKSLT